VLPRPTRELSIHALARGIDNLGEVTLTHGDCRARHDATLDTHGVFGELVEALCKALLDVEEGPIFEALSELPKASRNQDRKGPSDRGMLMCERHERRAIDGEERACGERGDIRRPHPVINDRHLAKELWSAEHIDGELLSLWVSRRDLEATSLNDKHAVRPLATRDHDLPTPDGQRIRLSGEPIESCIVHALKERNATQHREV
jgi:hypothetical protein